MAMNFVSTIGMNIKVAATDAIRNIGDFSSAYNTALDDMSLKADSFDAKWSDLTRGLKDTKRIVSGILVSRVFYDILGAVTSASGAVVSFTSDMQQAAISMEYFASGADKALKAKAFIGTMEDFAAKTPFTTEGALAMSKYMQAMGIGMNMTKSFLTVITDTAAATGATQENLQRIVFGLGQMKTKGRLANEEIRQLANANIPIYDILQEQLGLTGKQIANIGNYWIDADTAISAILTGLNKKYAGAADKISHTMGGLADTIKDDLLIIGESVLDGSTDKVTGFLQNVVNKLDEYRQITTTQGPVTLFKDILVELDPSGQLATYIIALIGNIRQLGAQFIVLSKTAAPIVEVFGQAIYSAVDGGIIALTSMIKVVNDVDAELEKFGLTSNFVFKALASLYIAYKVGKMFSFLGQGAIAAVSSTYSLAKSIITILPACVQARSGVAFLTAGLLGLVISIAAASGAFSSFNNVMAGLDSTMQNGLPKDFDDQMKAYQQAWDNYASQMQKYQKTYNDPYTDITKNSSAATDALNGVAKTSAKAAKSVQDDWTASFDEVYSIPDQKSTTDDAASQLSDALDAAGISGLLNFEFPNTKDKDVKEPTFNWNSLFNGSPLSASLNNGVLSTDFWKSMLPLLPLAGVGYFSGKFKELNGSIKGIGKGAKVAKETDSTISLLDGKEVKTAYATFSKGVKEINKTLDSDVELLMAAADSNNKENAKILKKAGIDTVNRDVYAELVDRLDKDLEKADSTLTQANKVANYLGKEPFSTDTYDNASSIRISSIQDVIDNLSDELKKASDTTPIDSLIAKRDAYSKRLDTLLGNVDFSMGGYTQQLEESYKTLTASVKDARSVILDFSNLYEYKDIAAAATDYAEKAEKVANILASTGKALDSDVISSLEKTKYIANDIVKQYTYLAEKSVEYQMLTDNVTSAVIRSDAGLYADLQDQRKELQELMNARVKRLYSDTKQVPLLNKKTDTPTNKVVKPLNDIRKTVEEESHVVEKATGTNGKSLEELQKSVDRTTETFKIADKTAEDYVTFAQRIPKEIAVKLGDIVDGKLVSNAALVKAFKQAKLAIPEGQITGSAYTVTITDAQYNRLAKILDEHGEFGLMNAAEEDAKTALKDILKQQGVAAADTIAMHIDRVLKPAPGLDNVTDLSKAGIDSVSLITGTKLSKLTEGLDSFGNSITSLIPEIAKTDTTVQKLGTKFYSNVTNRAMELGSQLEGAVIIATKGISKNISDIFAGNFAVNLEKNIVAQIDSYAKVGSNIISMDIKTMGGKMFSELFKDGIFNQDAFKRLEPNYYKQFGVQAQATNQSDVAMAVLNKDHRFSTDSDIYKKWKQIAGDLQDDLGNGINDIFSDRAMKAWGASLHIDGRELAERYYTDVLAPTLLRIDGKLDTKSLQEAMNVGIIHYTDEAFKELNIERATEGLHDLIELTKVLTGADGLKDSEKFFKTFIEMTGSTGRFVAGVDVTNAPRKYTSMASDATAWLQQVTGDDSLSLKNLKGFKKFYKEIDDVVDTFNETGDIDAFVTRIKQLRSGINKLVNGRDAKELMGIVEDATTNLTTVKGAIGSYADALNKGLDIIIEEPRRVLDLPQRMVRLKDGFDKLNNDIASGIPITYGRMEGMITDTEKAFNAFGITTVKENRKLLDRLYDAADYIKSQGDAAVLDMSVEFTSPFRFLDVNESTQYILGDALKAIADGTEEASQTVADNLVKLADKIQPKVSVGKIAKTISEGITDTTNRFLVDLETTGLIHSNAKLEPTMPKISQIAAGNMQSGEFKNWYINYGSEDANKEILSAMQNLRDTHDNLTEVAKQWQNVTLQQMNDGKALDVALQELADFVGKDPIIVGHNLSKFDARIIEYYTNLLDFSNIEDTLNMAKQIFAKQIGLKLTDLYTLLVNGSVDAAHNALEDIKMNAKVFEALTDGTAQELLARAKTISKTGVEFKVALHQASVDMGIGSDAITDAANDATKTVHKTTKAIDNGIKDITTTIDDVPGTVGEALEDSSKEVLQDTRKIVTTTANKITTEGNTAATKIVGNFATGLSDTAADVVASTGIRKSVGEIVSNALSAIDPIQGIVGALDKVKVPAAVVAGAYNIFDVLQVVGDAMQTTGEIENLNEQFKTYTHDMAATLSSDLEATLYKQTAFDAGTTVAGWIAGGIVGGIVAGMATGGVGLVVGGIVEALVQIIPSAIVDATGGNTLTALMGNEYISKSREGSLSKNEDDFIMKQIADEFASQGSGFWTKGVYDQILKGAPSDAQKQQYAQQGGSDVQGKNSPYYGVMTSAGDKNAFRYVPSTDTDPSTLFKNSTISKQMAELWVQQIAGVKGNLSDKELQDMSVNAYATGDREALKKYLVAKEKIAEAEKEEANWTTAQRKEYEKELADAKKWNQTHSGQGAMPLPSTPSETAHALYDNDLKSVQTVQNDPNVDEQRKFLNSYVSRTDDKLNVNFMGLNNAAKYLGLSVDEFATDMQGAGDLGAAANRMSILQDLFQNDPDIVKNFNDQLKKAGVSSDDLATSMSELSDTNIPYYNGLVQQVIDSAEKQISTQLDTINKFSATGTALTGFKTTLQKYDSNGDALGTTLSRMDITANDLLTLQSKFGISVDQLGNATMKAIDGFSDERVKGAIVTMPDKVAEALKNLDITTSDIQVLGSAGIQINGDGTVSLMKPVNGATIGTVRDTSSITAEDIDPSVIAAYKKNGIDISSSDTGTKMTISDPAVLAKKFTSLFYDTTGKIDDLAASLSKNDKTRLANAGLNIVSKTSTSNGQTTTSDSSTIQLSRALVTSGKTLTSLFKDASPELQKLAKLIDEQLGLGKGATPTSLIQKATGFEMPSFINKDSLSSETQSGLANMGNSFANGNMEFTGIGDDLENGKTFIGKDTADKLKAKLGGLFDALKITVKDGYIDLSNALSSDSNVAQIMLQNADVWNSLPTEVQKAFGASLINYDNGWLSIKAESDSKFAEYDGLMVQDYGKLSKTTQDSIYKMLNQDGVSVTTNGVIAIAEAYDGTVEGRLDNNTIAVPFEKLPKDVQDNLLEAAKKAGTSGEDLKKKLYTITTSARDNVIDAVGKVGTGVQDIVKKADLSLDDLKGALAEAARFQNISPKSSGKAHTFDFNKDVSGKGGIWTVTYNGVKYSGILASNARQAVINLEDYLGTDVSRDGKIGSFAYGGMITDDGLYRAGEFGDPEAIIPMKNKQSLGVIADAIMGRMSGYMTTDNISKLLMAMGRQNAGVQLSSKSSGTDLMTQTYNDLASKLASIGNAIVSSVAGNKQDNTKPILYVENLIADDTGLRELDRRMEVVRAKEGIRRGIVAK